MAAVLFSSIERRAAVAAEEAEAEQRRGEERQRGGHRHHGGTVRQGRREDAARAVGKAREERDPSGIVEGVRERQQVDGPKVAAAHIEQIALPSDEPQAVAGFGEDALVVIRVDARTGQDGRKGGFPIGIQAGVAKGGEDRVGAGCGIPLTRHQAEAAAAFGEDAVVVFGGDARACQNGAKRRLAIGVQAGVAQGAEGRGRAGGGVPLTRHQAEAAAGFGENALVVIQVDARADQVGAERRLATGIQAGGAKSGEAPGYAGRGIPRARHQAQVAAGPAEDALVVRSAASQEA